MKKCKCCTKVIFVVCTVSILGILKLVDVELIFPRSKSYFVEPQLLFSGTNKNVPPYDPSSDINCTSIFELEPSEIGKSLEIRRKRIYDLDDGKVLAMTKDCTAYKNLRQYHQKSFSKQEMDFPIAYSIVVHKDAINVERLLHTIYSPANVYCIHYDLKSSSEFQRAMINLADCFPNVFIASKLEKVIYAHSSRLKADLNCLSDLLAHPIQWKYAINLCGQDMLLKSNYELVSELKKLNGKNMLESSKPSDLKKQRYTYHHQVKFAYSFDYMPAKTVTEKSPPPSGIEMYVGSAYFVLNRDFIKYIFESSLVTEFLEWSEDTYSPDEHFWATLVRMPGVPGEIPRTQGDITDLDSKTRLVKWSYLEESLYPPCTGTHVRSVCIYGAAELRWLLTSGHWFGNKFDPKVDPILIRCLIEKLEQQQKEFVSLSSR